MSAVAFDPLEYARQLEAAGMPRPQAEVIARGLTAMFIHNFDTLVTKDYLETRLETLEHCLEAKMSSLLAQAFTSKNPGYARIEDRFDKMGDRFTQIDQRFNQIDVRFARVNVMLGIILAAVAVPILQMVVTFVI